MMNWKIFRFTIPLFILSLIFLVGLFFLLSLPLFQGPDEQIHYSTIQHRVLPPLVPPSVTEEEYQVNGKDIRTFHLPEETREAAVFNQFDDIKWQKENIQIFEPHTLFAPQEASFLQQHYIRRTESDHTHASGTTSFYYTVTVEIERALAHLPFSDRFMAMRLFSLLLYFGTILLAYSIARKVFTGALTRSLFTLTIAFQPMLLATGTIINIDVALIFSFSLFFLAALLVMEHPHSVPLHIFLLFTVLLGIYAKGPGLTLFVVLLFFYASVFQKYSSISLSSFFLRFSLCLIILGILLFFLLPPPYVSSIINLEHASVFPTPAHSLVKYADKTLALDAFQNTHASYWGHFGWLDTKISSFILKLLWIIEALAWFGIFLFLFSKRAIEYLPKKSLIFLSLSMVIALQLAIRFFDWRIFDTTGQLLIGTPGRYFLPTLIPHFLILVTGLGFLFTKNRTQFTTLLKALAVGMILLCIYSLFNVIIPRYYL